jgi:hypothetical protein
MPTPDQFADYYLLGCDNMYFVQRDQYFGRTTYIPEYDNLHSHCCESLKSHLLKFVNTFQFWLKLDNNKTFHMKTYNHFCACVELSLNTYWKKKNVSNKSCSKNETDVL